VAKPPVAEETVPVEAGQHGAAGRGAEDRHVEVGVGRPHQSELGQAPPGDVTEEIELVVHVDALPLLESEVRDDVLLPVGLLGEWLVGEPEREGDRQRQPFAARDVRGDGEDGGGVPSAGETDDTRRALEKAPDDALERSAGGSHRAVWQRRHRLRSEGDARGTFEPGERGCPRLAGRWLEVSHAARRGAPWVGSGGSPGAPRWPPLARPPARRAP
jgi:hypothetical protein